MLGRRQLVEAAVRDGNDVRGADDLDLTSASLRSGKALRKHDERRTGAAVQGLGDRSSTFDEYAPLAYPTPALTKPLEQAPTALAQLHASRALPG